MTPKTTQKTTTIEAPNQNVETELLYYKRLDQTISFEVDSSLTLEKTIAQICQKAYIPYVFVEKADLKTTAPKLDSYKLHGKVKDIIEKLISQQELLYVLNENGLCLRKKENYTHGESTVKITPCRTG